MTLLGGAGDTKVVKLTVNGQPKETAARNVVILLGELGLLPTQVAVELNGVVLFRHELEQTQLSEADRLEIVKVVAGG